MDILKSLINTHKLYTQSNLNSKSFPRVINNKKQKCGKLLTGCELVDKKLKSLKVIQEEISILNIIVDKFLLTVNHF